MIGLDRLMKIKGVVAAGQFNENGEIVRSVGNLDDEIKELSARVSSKIQKTIKEEIDILSKQNKEIWGSLEGWAFWSGKYSFCIVGRTGVIVETSKTDFNNIMISLIGDGPSGYKQMNY